MAFNLGFPLVGVQAPGIAGASATPRRPWQSRLFDRLVPESSANLIGVNDADKKALVRQGLLQLAAGIQSSPNFGQGLTQGLLAGSQSLNQGLEDVQARRLREQQLLHLQNAGLPTEYRSLDLMAKAAGHQPGTAGYRKFFEVKGGLAARAMTGARKNVEIVGADGVKRPGVFDPSSPYGYSVYDESVGQFRPLEAGETPTETAAPSALPSPMGGAPTVLGGSALNQAVEHVESGGNPYAVSPKGAIGPMQTMPGTLRAPGFGVMPAQNASIDEQRRVGQDYLGALAQKYGPVGGLAAYNWGPGNWEAALQRSGGDPQRALSMAPPETQAYVPKVLAQAQGGRPAASPSIAVGRPPEEQAALTAAAEENAKLGLLPRRNELEAQGEAMKTMAKGEAQTAVDVRTKQLQKVRDAQTALALLDQAEGIIPQATGSGLGSRADVAAGFFGQTTAGAEATDQLKIIAERLTQQVPRFEGPQSDKDTESYRRAAGDLANDKIPRARRLKALETLRDLNLKAVQYQGAPPPVTTPRATAPRPAQAPAAPKPQQGWGIRRVP